MLTDAIFSPATLLWLAGALIAFFLLTGSMFRRQVSLTELLRNYVSKNQGDFDKPSVESPPKKPVARPSANASSPPDSSKDS